MSNEKRAAKRNVDRISSVDLLCGLSHDLAEPISVIQGYSEVLLGGALDEPGRGKEFVRTIHRQAKWLGSVIEDVLTMSQLESGQVVMRKENFLLAPKIRSVIADLRPMLRRKTIVCRVEKLPALSVHADADEVQRILRNLVDNAAKYNRSRGAVRIALTRRTREAEVAVSDDGVGISKDDLPHVFDRFFRSRDPRKRAIKGTGLGLTLVKQLVEMNDGRVRVESVPGRGTTVRFTLPLSKDSAS